MATAEIASINIPTQVDNIVIFPDELPVGELDYNDLIDVLRSVLAPLDVWRKCALEYYRQGFVAEFNSILSELVENLSDPNVEKAYSLKPDFSERKAEIYDALAASILQTLVNIAVNDSTKDIVDDLSKKIKEYLRKSEDLMSLSEYRWLIKGFFDLSQGDMNDAEVNFRNVFDRSSKGIKKRNQFGAVLGLALLNFKKENSNLATPLDYLCKAIYLNPGCGANVRVAIAELCYKLGHFDRARYALNRALQFDPDNFNSLIMLSLLDQNDMKKDKSLILQESRQLCIDYCIMAVHLNPYSAVALNRMANVLIYVGKLCHNCQVIDDKTIQLHQVDASNIEINVNDMIEITDSQNYLIQNVEYRSETFLSPNGDTYSSTSIYLYLSSPLPVSSGKIRCKVKELGKAKQFAHEALSRSTSKIVLSESYFLLGRISHTQGDIDDSYEYYLLSLRENPEMSLAEFEAAKILFSKKDFELALELFERIRKKYVDDRDTLGFIHLIRSITMNEIFPMDKIREVAVNFQYEIDLWLMQGINRHKDPNEYGAALKCYNTALELIRSRKKSIDSNMYCNIATLHHGLGKLQNALEYIVLAIRSKQYQSESEKMSEKRSSIFCSSDLEGVLYFWDVTPYVMIKSNADSYSFKAVLNDLELDNTVNSNFNKCFSPGDEVMIDNIRVIVADVDSDSCSLRVKTALVNLFKNDTECKVYKKVSLIELNIESIIVHYNYARILEDIGKTKAAFEIYNQIVNIHPSFIECYLRLSDIAKSVGKFDDASAWISKAFAVDEGYSDTVILQGDLFIRNGQLDEAKRCYEKIVQKNRHDPRSILSLGNLYFSTLGHKYESSSKDSQKFFHSALHDDKRNIYAAVGIGMVIAEKGKYDAAKEIFSRAREASISNGDILSNLANINMKQSRFNDAEHLYQVSAKLSLKISSLAFKLPQLYECLSYCQLLHNKFDEAVRTLHRLLYQYPILSTLWYKIAILYKLKACALVKSVRSPGEEFSEVQSDFSFAIAVLKFVHNNYHDKALSDKIKSNIEVCKKFRNELVQRFPSRDSTSVKATDDTHLKRKNDLLDEIDASDSKKTKLV